MYLDRLEYSKDLFGRFDGRCRLIAAVVLISALISATGAGVPCVCIAACLAVSARELRVTVLRLLPVNAMAVALWLPVVAGGSPETALLYSLRVNCAALLYMCLISPMSTSRLAASMSALRAPGKLVTLFILTYRHVFLLYEGLATALISMRLRLAERGHIYRWRALAAVFSTTLVRAAIRSERVAVAMASRGFDGDFPSADKLRWKPIDSALLATAVIIAALVLTVGQV